MGTSRTKVHGFQPTRYGRWVTTDQTKRLRAAMREHEAAQPQAKPTDTSDVERAIAAARKR